MLHDQNETQKRVNRDSEEKKYKLQFYATIVYKEEDFLVCIWGSRQNECFFKAIAFSIKAQEIDNAALQ